MRCRLLALISGVSVAAVSAGVAGCAAQTATTSSESSTGSTSSKHSSNSASSHTSGASSSTSMSAGTGPSNGGKLGPYTTSGNKILDKNGNEHWFRGLDRPSLEWSCSGDIQSVDYQGMQMWGANIVRLPLNQDCWLSTSGNTSYDSTYAGTVDQQVQWAEENGMDIILDLHWSDKGSFATGAACLANNNMNCQEDMADTNSTEFWKEVATKYKGDPSVIFELYNEPKIGGYMPQAADWNTWLNGGTSSGFTVVGMQSLYDTVRATGAQNIVIIGGLNWAYDLTGVPTHAVQGTNIVYNTHPYANHGTNFSQYFGSLTATYPVIATEFGDTSSGQPSTCSGTFDTNVLNYMDGVSGGIPHKMSWTAWAFYVSSCTFPSLLADSNYDPNTPGMAVQSALMAGP
jgi:hypothetical protein